MIILGDPGGTGFGRDISGKNIANCLYVDELELCAKEFQVDKYPEKCSVGLMVVEVNGGTRNAKKKDHGCRRREESA